MTVVSSVLSEVKVCIITNEFQNASFTKKLSTLTKLLKNCSNEPDVVYIDDFLSEEDKLTPETQCQYVKKCFDKFKNHAICIPLFGSDHDLKKTEFNNSLLSRVMRFMLHISIVNESWLNDLQIAYNDYIANLKNGAKKKKIRPLAVGKTERRFDDELANAISYRSCVLEKLSGKMSDNQISMLEIILNFVDVNTEVKPTVPTIDGECYILPDEHEIESFSNGSQGNGIPSIHLKTIFEQIQSFVIKRNASKIFKGSQFIFSSEISSFQPLASLLKIIIKKLGGETLESISAVKDITKLYSIEDTISKELNYILPENRCSLYYLLERWGLNVEAKDIDSAYKFAHHYPFDSLKITKKELKHNSSLQFSLSGFFGHKKFMAQTMLKKLEINVVNYMTSSFTGLFTYANYGDKYNFSAKKGIKIVNAKCIDKIYFEALFDVTKDYSGKNLEIFLCNTADLAIRKTKKYYTETNPSPASEQITEVDSFVISENAANELPSQKNQTVNAEGNEAKTVSSTSEQQEISTKDKKPNKENKSTSSQEVVSLKRKLDTGETPSQSSQRPKKTKSAVEDMSIFDSIAERVSLAGGNNNGFTFQDSGKRMKVILAGIDLKSETTNTNYVYMSGIRHKADLYKTNLYILDKMGLEISEDKNYKECDVIIIKKKTSTFYESLAYTNIAHYVDMKFIESLLEKVYKRKKNISLDLKDYWYKELLSKPEFMKNREQLNGQLIFVRLNVENLVLLNPNDTEKHDPKEIVFKTHGFSKQIEIKGFDKRLFNIDNLCKHNVYNLIVVNNTVKSLNNVIGEFRKSSNLKNYKMVLVTWETIVKMLLSMDVSYILDEKNVLVKSP